MNMIKIVLIVLYALFAFIVSYFIGKGKLYKETGKKDNCEAIWNGLMQLYGFVLLLGQAYLLFTIVNSGNSSTQIVCGIIFFPIFFYTLFCISGRGIEILHKISDKGIKNITISWKGISIDFRE